ncbi:MAG TPA: CRISPR-associated helicase Cas3' [Bacteroidales bacterium]|nr:CRISPR-associated helicase Cas3' [Bacteroidales bacterium]
MKYFSHSGETEAGEIEGSKFLKDHIEGVKSKALHQFYNGVNFDQATDKLRHLLKVIVNFHDIGKYTGYFQNYLLRKENIDFKLKQHSRFGGYAAYNFLKDENEKNALIALYIIFHHHLQLIDLYNIASKINDESRLIFKEQIKSIAPAIETIKHDLKIEKIEEFLQFLDENKIRKQAITWVRREQDISDYFLINYLFSLLIEADKLDASDTSVYSLKKLNDYWVDERFGVPDLSGFGDLAGLSNNELRNYCRAEVIHHLEDNDILDQHLFTLTAPTGIGKTMTALDFSLKLKAKLRREKDHEPQIIYALPFINIIEQAINEYEKTLAGENSRILGHYQFADVFGIQKDSGDESDSYHQKLMTLDTWQSDIVITSFVQFFETVISNRNKLLKKFNHLAGSIIILDEVQTLRLDQMPFIGATLFYVSKFLDARILMMTATKPKIFDLAEEEILKNEGESVHPKELLTSHEKVFSLFERTAIHPLLESLTGNEDEKDIQFVEEIFDSRWQTDKSCLIICNTVNRSIEIYEGVINYLKERDLDNAVYYLSTNIIPADRLGRIKKLKKAIEKEESPILIATQVVEAGVDLDFDMGFRDVGPVDSIIQVAGRINRNNDKNRKYAPLYIVDFEECQKVYGQLTYRQALKVLEKKDIILESDYLKIIEQYFNDISDRSSFRASREYFKSIKSLKYDSEDKRDYSVSAFRIIEESDLYRSVFIERDEKASILREKYLEKIIGDISREEFDRLYKMDFQQHIVSVPHYYTSELLPINEYEENILVVSRSEVDEFYGEVTGFIRDQKTDAIMIL